MISPQRTVLALTWLVCASALTAGPGPDAAEAITGFGFTAAFPQDTGMVDHDEYDINIRLFPSTYFLQAQTRSVFRSRVARLGRVHFVLYNDTLSISSVTSGPDTLTFEYDRGSATLTVQLDDTLDPGQADTIMVTYSGYITPALGNALNNYCRLDSTLGFSILPYVWYPSPYDQQYSSRRDETFACRTTLTVPRNWRAAGVGALADSVVTDSTQTYTWQTDRPVATSCFGAGKYALSVRDMNGLQVRYYDFDTSAAPAVFSAVGSILDYLSRTFGPCPLEKLAYAENLQVYGAAAVGLILSPLPYQLSGVTHETAHQWWGGAVRLRYGPEVWLSEGFASYSEVLFQEDSLGLPVRRAELDTMARRYLAVPRAQDRPIVPAPTGSNYYFTIVYSKGAWVMHMLRWVLGDSIFFQALNTYSLSNRDSSVTVSGFRATVEQVGGLDLGWFFNEWLYSIGYPKYHLDWSAEPVGDSSRVVISLRQVNGSGAPAFFRTPLPVRLGISGPDTTVVIQPAANPQIDTFVVNGHPLTLLVDPDDWVLDSSYVIHTGVGEGQNGEVRGDKAGVTIVRGVLFLPPLGTRPELPERNSVMSRTALLDICGRRVLSLHPGPNDVSRLAPGVYFVSSPDARGVARVVILNWEG